MLQRVPIGPVGSHLPSACEAGGFVVSWDSLTLSFLWAFVQTVTYVWDNLPPDNHMTSLALLILLFKVIFSRMLSLMKLREPTLKIELERSARLGWHNPLLILNICIVLYRTKCVKLTHTSYLIIITTLSCRRITFLEVMQW